MANALGILEKMEKLMEVILLLLWGFIDCCVVSSNEWKNFGQEHYHCMLVQHSSYIPRVKNLNFLNVMMKRNWELAKCSKYLEAVTYNLAQSISHDELYTTTLQQKGLDESQVLSLKAITLRKKQFLVKVYLQYCAVSSQLNKFELFEFFLTNLKDTTKRLLWLKRLNQ